MMFYGFITPKSITDNLYESFIQNEQLKAHSELEQETTAIYQKTLSEAQATAPTVKPHTIKSNQFKQLDKGAVKDVWIKANGSTKDPNQLPKNVHYTPVDSWFKDNESELRGEVRLMQAINTAIINKEGGSTAHLALDIKESKNAIDGKYTAKIGRADGSVEKFIRDPKINMQQRTQWCVDYLHGLKNLHSIDKVHGDQKPDNILLFKVPGTEDEYTAKLSDFGKTVDAGNQKHQGNVRFMSPEGTLDKASDVYAAGLVMIRILEESILGDTKSLIEIDPAQQDMVANSKLRGIEKYIVEHKDFIGFNSGSLIHAHRRLNINNRSQVEKEKQNIALNAYIDTLTNSLPFPKQKAQHLNALLKQMTALDPQNRISMDLAYTVLSAINDPNIVIDNDPGIVDLT